MSNVFMPAFQKGMSSGSGLRSSGGGVRFSRSAFGNPSNAGAVVAVAVRRTNSRRKRNSTGRRLVTGAFAPYTT